MGSVVAGTLSRTLAEATARTFRISSRKSVAMASFSPEDPLCPLAFGPYLSL